MLRRIKTAVNGKVKYELLNSDGEDVGFKYKYIGEFQNGFAIIETKNGIGLINEYGKEIIPCQYYSVIPFVNGNEYAEVKKSGFIFWKYGLYDKRGNLVVPCKFTKVNQPDNRGNVKVYNFEKVGLFNIKKNELIIPCRFDDIIEAKNGCYEIFGNGASVLVKINNVEENQNLF